MNESFLVMKDIQKQFGKVTALLDAHFELAKGEVHALLGANGAGKSTLMKILSGAYEQDSGEIILAGKNIHLKSPKAAKDLGIYCVYQEVDTAIIPELTVAENILLDSFAASKDLFISKKKIQQKAREVLQELQAEYIAVNRPAFQLTLAEKQLVLIARALVHEAKIIIFDEPTAPLSLQEASRLFTVIDKLKKQGVCCIYISHRLPEVFEICDRITVMREGTTIQTMETVATTQTEVVEHMLGKTFTSNEEKVEKEIGGTVLEVNKLSDTKKLHDISFSVAAGEIVGIVGLVGAGKTELAKALMGVTPVKIGALKLKGRDLHVKHPKVAIQAGMVLIPEERRKEGLFIHESLRKNATFPNLRMFSKGLVMNSSAEKTFSEKVVSLLQIKTGDIESPLVHLSGGNQQKVAIGKWMSRESTVYLFDEPTKGVDIGAKSDIFNLIHGLAKEGKGILYFSSEIHEILTISDRILVMLDGRIVKEFSQAEATQEKILLYASGGKEEQNEREKFSASI